MEMDSLAERLVQIVPSARQLQWQRNELTAFLHFGMNTFTDREWGDGTDAVGQFNPTALDTDQWCRTLVSAGVRAVLLTAKHHDGFCLWDTKQTDYSAMRSPFGKDVVRLLADACKAHGLKLGLYLSPWDRHEPRYGQGVAYDDFFCAQLEELLTGYGPLYCMWFDGACGEGPNGRRQVYDWERYCALIRRHQPMAAISVCGPDVRWCGNEAGHCRKAEWSVVPARLSSAEKVHADSQQQDDEAFRLRPIKSADEDLGSREVIRDEPNLIWYPAEVDVSIRPGWFYHAKEDGKVKSLDTLLDMYKKSVGGNSVLLLNVPPDRRGLIHEADAARLAELGDAVRRLHAGNVATDAEVEASASVPGHGPRLALVDDGQYWMGTAERATMTLKFKAPIRIGRAILMEHIELSQRIESFTISAVLPDGAERQVFEGACVGYKRICEFEPVLSTGLTLQVHQSRVAPTLQFLGAYEAGEA